MEKSTSKIASLCEDDVDALQSLVDEFVQTHQSLTFRDNYWQSFRAWLIKGVNDNNTIALMATCNGAIAGFIIGDIKENAPLIVPEMVGYVGILVVAEKFRKGGLGESLWNELRGRFKSRDINYFELYTEYGNKVSGPFWRKRGFHTFMEKRRLREVI